MANLSKAGDSQAARTRVKVTEQAIPITTSANRGEHSYKTYIEYNVNYTKMENVKAVARFAG